jgi:hypothetical protein
MEALKIAWIGKESEFTENLEKGIVDFFPDAKIQIEKIEILSSNLHLLFKENLKHPFDWIFLDFSDEREYKVDLCKIMAKYNYFNNATVIGIMDDRDKEVFSSDFLSLPIHVFAVKKKDVKEIIEDIQIVNSEHYEKENYFSTPGYGEVLWLQVPCKANYKDGKLKIYSPIADFTEIAFFKQYLKEKEIVMTEKIKEWIDLPAKSMMLSLYNKNKEELVFQGSNFSKYKDNFKVDLNEEDNKRLTKVIDKYKVSSDTRKRVLVFDPMLDFFTRCWGTKKSNEKVNMINFPEMQENYALIESLDPDLIVIRYFNNEINEKEQQRIQNYLDLLVSKTGFKPYVIIFNHDDAIQSKYEKLLLVKEDMSVQFIDNIINLLTKSRGLYVGDQRIKLDEVLHEWRNSRLTNTIYLNLPVLIMELSEKFLLLKCPFKLDKKLVTYERDRFGVFMGISPELESNDKDSIYGTIILKENEKQKTDIRHFVNYVNFKPKSAEQLKEYQDFLELKNARIRERALLRSKRKKKKKRI